MNGRLIKPVASVLALVGLAAMGGCDVSGGGESTTRRDRDRTRIEDRPRDPYYDRGRDGDRIGDRAGDRVGDRGEDAPAERASGIPGSARLMERGKGMLTLSATRDGRVFVEDANDLRLLLETQLFEGEVLTVDPGGDVIAIDGKPLPGPRRTRKLGNDHRHRIYFQGERALRSGGQRGDRDVRY